MYNLKMKILVFIIIILLATPSLFSQQFNEIISIDEDIELIKISDDAFVHRSWISHTQWGRLSANGLVYIQEHGALLLDTPWTAGQTEKLFNWLMDSMQVKTKMFIPNHWHEDCMGGYPFLEKMQVESYAYQQTIDIANSKKISCPEKGFADSLELKFESQIIKCYFLGAAHSTDNIVVWIPSAKILFAGCMVKSLESRNLGNTSDGDIVAYPETLSRLLNKFQEARIVVPGHGNPGGIELIEHTIKLAGQ